MKIENPREFVSVRINGQMAGIHLWPPFNFEVTAFLKTGKNFLELDVTNTYANDFTKDTFPSGLQGPVKLIPWQRFDVQVEYTQ